MDAILTLEVMPSRCPSSMSQRIPDGERAFCRMVPVSIGGNMLNGAMRHFAAWVVCRMLPAKRRKREFQQEPSQRE